MSKPTPYTAQATPKVHHKPGEFQRPAVQVPDEIARACQILHWTILRVGSYGGTSSYIVRDAAGITEPYSAQAILAAQSPL